MGHGGVYKRGATWWIRYQVEGRRYRESAETPRKEQAQALLAKRINEVWEGKFFPDVASKRYLTLGGLRDMWVSERSTKRSLEHDKARLGRFVERLGEFRLVSTITGDDVAAWRDELAASLGVATVNRHLAVLRSALNLARDKGHSHRDPMRGIRFAKEDNRRNRECSREEYAALCDAASNDLRLLIIIGFWNGMRLGEIVGLKWQQIDLVFGQIRLSGSDTKEGDSKTIPIPGEALSVLRDMPRSISGRIFSHSAVYYSGVFAALAKRLGICGLRFHDLRHTAVTNLRRAGVDLETIRQITGHKTLAMLQRYNVVTPDDLRAAMSRAETHAAASLDFSKR